MGCGGERLARNGSGRYGQHHVTSRAWAACHAAARFLARAGRSAIIAPCCSSPAAPASSARISSSRLSPKRGEAVVKLDKLTYAGNLCNLAALQRRRAPHFVQGDICDRDAGARAASQSTSRARSCTSRPRATSTARSPGRRNSCRPTWSAPGPCSRKRAPIGQPSDAMPNSASCTSRPTRSMARSGRSDPAFTEETPYAPNSPYAASKAAADHLVRAYHHTYGLPVLTTNCSNNYGPAPVPGEADSADDPQRARGQAAAGLRRRAQCARLAVRRRPLRGAAHGARQGQAGRDLQHRRRKRAREHRASCRRCASSSIELRPRKSRRLCRADPFVDGSARPRPSLCDEHLARSAASSAGSRRRASRPGLEKTVRWYLDEPAERHFAEAAA